MDAKTLSSSLFAFSFDGMRTRVQFESRLASEFGASEFAITEKKKEEREGDFRFLSATRDMRLRFVSMRLLPRPTTPRRDTSPRVQKRPMRSPRSETSNWNNGYIRGKARAHKRARAHARVASRRAHCVSTARRRAELRRAI